MKRVRLVVLVGAIVAVHAAVAAAFVGGDGPGDGAAWRGFPLDDAWIHLVYARAVATHGAPYYIDGVLEAGFTSPLWMLLLALVELLGRLGAPVVPLVKALGVSCAAAASLGVLALARRLGAPLGAAVFGALLLAVSPTFGFAQVSGMEVPLAAACAVWALERLAAERLWAAGLLLAAAALARPEMAVLVMVVAAAHLRPWRSLIPLLAPAAVAAALWSAYCLAVTGHPLPNTFYAKAHGGGLSSVWHLLTGVVADMPLVASVTGALLWVGGAVVLVVGRLGEPAPGRLGVSAPRRLGAIVVAAPLLFAAAVGASRQMPARAGEYFYWLRWALPVEPLYFVTAAVGLGALWSLPSLAPAIRRGAAVLLAVGVLAAVPGRLADRAEQYAWNCANMEEVQVAMGRWVADNVAPSETVLVNDAGAIRYFGQRRTIDLIGLNTHELLFGVPRSLLGVARRNTKGMLELMHHVDGDVLIVFPVWAPDLFQSKTFQGWFTPVHVLRSEHYTVSPSRQDLMVALRVAAGALGR